MIDVRLAGAIACACLTAALCGPVRAQDAAGVQPCTGIDDDAVRLRCYDRAAGRRARAERRDTPAPEGSPPAGGDRAAPDTTVLDRLWHLGSDEVLGLHVHEANFLLPARWTSAVNERPLSPELGSFSQGSLENAEAKYRFSVKSRLWQGLANGRLDVWVAYSQQAQWQLYRASGPFRAIDHQPEIMALSRSDAQFLGNRLRYVNVGVSHHSNGRGGVESRSWNRLYAQFGFTRGDDLALQIRPWIRLAELERRDGNPDIVDRYGAGDATVYVSAGRHAFEFTLRAQPSLRDPRGAVQVDWSYPLYRQIRAYVQLFHGHGESLIDYNHRQTAVGAGLALIGWD